MHEPPDRASGQSERYTTLGKISRRLIFIAPILVFGLVALAIFNVLGLVRLAVESERQTESSYEVTANANELYAAVSDAETDQRTYLLTKEPAAFEGFQSAKVRAANKMGELANQLGSSKESLRLKAISRLVLDRVASLQAAIDLHQTGGDQPAQIQRGDASMRELRESIAQLVNDEQRLVDERRAAIERKKLATASGSLMAILSLLLLGGLGASAFIRARSQLAARTDEAREADKRFEAMFDQAEVGMALIAPDGRWLRVNDRFCAIIESTRKQLIGESFHEITHPDDAPNDFVHLNDLLTGQTAQYSAEKRYNLPSGKLVWVNVSATMIRDELGQPDFIVEVIEEITDWKAAQALVIAGEAQYRAIFDSAVEAIAVIDEKGVIQSLNPAAKQIFGYRPKEIIGRNISMLMPQPTAGEHDSYLARYKKTGKRVIIGIGREVEGLRKDGTTFPLDLSVAEWKQEGKTFYTGIMRDITERRNALAALAASEERLRLAQDATGIGSFDWDLVTGEIIGNDSYYRITGSDSQARLFADSISSIIHPEDRDRISSALQDSLANDAPTDLELRLTDVEGRPRWVRSLAKTIHDANDEPARRIGVLIDITGRRVAEGELRENEERLRLALASGHLGTWSVDAKTGSVDLDSISRSIFDLKPGWNPDLFEFAALIHAEDQARYADVQKGIMADAPALDFEFRIVIRDGSTRWIHSTATRFGDEESGGTRMTGVALDVTEQKEAVEKLRQSEARLGLALASGNLGTWSFDPKAGILRFDQIAVTIFGLGENHLNSLAEFKSLLHPEDQALFENEYQLLLAGSDTLNVEYRLPQDDGSVRWVHVSGTIDRAANPDLQQLIGVVTDVTEKRGAEERLRVLQNEFAHLDRVSDLGEMAAAIAHEINQPLTAISNYLNAGIETARKSAEPQQSGVETMMERAAEQALRAGQIVRRLREFIGKGTGERDARLADHLIDAITEFAAVDSGVNGVTIVRKAGAGGALVSVDVVQFHQVVVNLIRNAIDALSTNAPGVERKLTVETRIGDSGEAVEFMIADTGPGIHPDIRLKLFEPFTTSKANGMGMGLSVCKRLIEAHGGSIRIESPAAGGAAFHFTLPIVSNEE